jgi:hypothetical protein
MKDHVPRHQQIETHQQIERVARTFVLTVVASGDSKTAV